MCKKKTAEKRNDVQSVAAPQAAPVVVWPLHVTLMWDLDVLLGPSGVFVCVCVCVCVYVSEGNAGRHTAVAELVGYVMVGSYCCCFFVFFTFPTAVWQPQVFFDRTMLDDWIIGVWFDWNLT